MPHKMSVTCILTFLLWTSFTPRVRAGDKKEQDQETLRNAATVLQSMLNAKSVPDNLLAKANCVIVMPSVKKGALIIGGTEGRGPMSCRGGKNFTGQWSAPAMTKISGASVGLQVGGSASDFVLLIMSGTTVDKVLEGNAKIGGNVTAVAGPSGATSTGSVEGTDILSYGRTSGLFAGMSLNDALLLPDDDANERLYGKGTSARHIVLGGKVKTPSAGEPLVSLLNSKIPEETAPASAPPVPPANAPAAPPQAAQQTPPAPPETHPATTNYLLLIGLILAVIAIIVWWVVKSARSKART